MKITPANFNGNLNYNKTENNVSISQINTNISESKDISVNNKAKNNIEVIDLSSAELEYTDEDSWIFNPELDQYRLFGGNQGSLIENIDQFIADDQINAIISKYYDDFNYEDKELLFTKMNNVGCGYTAAINTILSIYDETTSDDFYRRFGFPLYKTITVDGKQIKRPNYEYLLLDYFLYYAKNEEKFTSIEEVYGEITSSDKDTEDGAISGKILRGGMDGTYLSEVADVLDRYLAEKGIKFKHELYGYLEPGTEEWKEKRDELLEIVDVVPNDQPLYSTNYDINTIKEMLMEGKKLIISSSYFNLYYPEDKDGNGKYDDVAYEDVGAHAMSIVGITSDDKLIVSSWGNEYVFDVENGDSIRIEIYDYSGFQPEKNITSNNSPNPTRLTT